MVPSRFWRLCLDLVKSKLFIIKQIPLFAAVMGYVPKFYRDQSVAHIKPLKARQDSEQYNNQTNSFSQHMQDHITTCLSLCITQKE